MENSGTSTASSASAEESNIYRDGTRLTVFGRDYIIEQIRAGKGMNNICKTVGLSRTSVERTMAQQFGITISTNLIAYDLTQNIIVATNHPRLALTEAHERAIRERQKAGVDQEASR